LTHTTHIYSYSYLSIWFENKMRSLFHIFIHSHNFSFEFDFIVDLWVWIYWERYFDFSHFSLTFQVQQQQRRHQLTLHNKHNQQYKIKHSLQLTFHYQNLKSDTMNSQLRKILEKEVMEKCVLEIGMELVLQSNSVETKQNWMNSCMKWDWSCMCEENVNMNEFDFWIPHIHK
jgi:hypothetical protein